MIRPLRRVHQRVWQVAALALPLVLVAALLTRPPSAAALPEGMSATVGESAWPGLPLALRREPSRLRVRVLGPLPGPDLLLYAIRGSAGAGQPLPAGASFLGSLAGASQLLAPPPEGSHQLVLYSLAHGQVVDSAPIPAEGP